MDEHHRQQTAGKHHAHDCRLTCISESEPCRTTRHLTDHFRTTSHPMQVLQQWISESVFLNYYLFHGADILAGSAGATTIKSHRPKPQLGQTVRHKLGYKGATQTSHQTECCTSAKGEAQVQVLTFHRQGTRPQLMIL